MLVSHLLVYGNARQMVWAWIRYAGYDFSASDTHSGVMGTPGKMVILVEFHCDVFEELEVSSFVVLRVESDYWAIFKFLGCLVFFFNIF